MSKKFWFDRATEIVDGATVVACEVNPNGRADILLSNGKHIRLMETLGKTVDIDLVSESGFVYGLGTVNFDFDTNELNNPMSTELERKIDEIYCSWITPQDRLDWLKKFYR